VRVQVWTSKTSDIVRCMLRRADDDAQAATGLPPSGAAFVGSAHVDADIFQVRRFPDFAALLSCCQQGVRLWHGDAVVASAASNREADPFMGEKGRTCFHQRAWFERVRVHLIVARILLSMLKMLNQGLENCLSRPVDRRSFLCKSIVLMHCMAM
jgi:hypothetical protein